MFELIALSKKQGVNFTAGLDGIERKGAEKTLLK
ncbi:hypothetical protein FBY58_1850 [Zymomonas mobilis]|uniref:Uncharacterized protein n=1 Tax=Zymomonas mobilis TaxID=542 RepID=A0A542VUC7_ZYMMB|nr:hypothetical protein FBY58_1850 [Zymomonas mobilis]